MSTSRTYLYVCHCRSDASWLERLRVHLKPLERRGLIEAWDDTRIRAGTDWRRAVERALNDAGAAVLLVSADWAASDFIQDVELPRLLARARTEGVPVLPVLVSPCHTALLLLGGLAFVNDQSLIGLPEVEREAVLVRTAQTVLVALGLPSATSASAAPSTDPQQAKNELTQFLKQRFRQSERNNLLFRLGLDPEDVKLRPEDREEFSRAMVVHADNQGRLADLWDEASRERPALLRGRPNPFR